MAAIHMKAQGKYNYKYLKDAPSGFKAQGIQPAKYKFVKEDRDLYADMMTHYKANVRSTLRIAKPGFALFDRLYTPAKLSETSLAAEDIYASLPSAPASLGPSGASGRLLESYQEKPGIVRQNIEKLYKGKDFSYKTIQEVEKRLEDRQKYAYYRTPEAERDLEQMKLRAAEISALADDDDGVGADLLHKMTAR